MAPPFKKKPKKSPESKFPDLNFSSDPQDESDIMNTTTTTPPPPPSLLSSRRSLNSLDFNGNDGKQKKKKPCDTPSGALKIPRSDNSGHDHRQKEGGDCGIPDLNIPFSDGSADHYDPLSKTRQSCRKRQPPLRFSEVYGEDFRHTKKIMASKKPSNGPSEADQMGRDSRENSNTVPTILQGVASQNLLPRHAVSQFNKLFKVPDTLKEILTNFAGKTIDLSSLEQQVEGALILWSCDSSTSIADIGSKMEQVKKFVTNPSFGKDIDRDNELINDIIGTEDPVMAILNRLYKGKITIPKAAAELLKYLGKIGKVTCAS